jgi:hypothetical protein
MPILAHLENILQKRNICAAAYHGGKLNGVDYQELITVAYFLYQEKTGVQTKKLKMHATYIVISVQH